MFETAAKAVVTLPFLSMVICAMLAFSKIQKTQRLAAFITAGAIGAAFVFSCLLLKDLPQVEKNGVGAVGTVVHYFDWINIGDFTANFSFYIDGLTAIMLMVVTGVGTLIAVYASWYMDGDVGYGRFFTYISLFIFAMLCLVMGDNLLLLFLGWEGVGAASYLLIGFYYRKPSAVAAAKKAFIVNRVGDFGFALGLMGVFVVFGGIQYVDILPAAKALAEPGMVTNLSETQAAAHAAATDYWGEGKTVSLLLLSIPFLLMLGAFGKSAQLPLHVWLPDAMEGPTPVSALIHAATMVTAGVYMISRLIPIFQLNEAALLTVAVIGCVTALFAGLIALCQYDIKRVWAYSTVSQLGYMFLGVGVLGTTGAVFHLFTHAFFKALLFLTAGTVMHALAGQLDLRKMSGLRTKMPITCWLMFAGCLALAGFPFTSGWYSKDMILVDAMATYPLLGWLGILTALLTAFYTFRLWFKVFWGPTDYEMGNEHHGYEADHHDEDHHHHEPHDPPMWANLPLMVLTLGAVAGGFLGYGFIKNFIGMSSAAVPIDPAHKVAHDAAHAWVPWVASAGAIAMIGLAWVFYVRNRALAENCAKTFKGAVRVLYNKFYVDELYDVIIRRPLRGMGHICHLLFDQMLIDTVLVGGIAKFPRLLAWGARPFQNGALQGYGLSMGAGVAMVLFVLYMVTK